MKRADKLLVVQVVLITTVAGSLFMIISSIIDLANDANNWPSSLLRMALPLMALIYGVWASALVDEQIRKEIRDDDDED